MKKLRLLSFGLIFSFVFLFFNTHSAHAATLYWVGNDGANASVASNWKTTNPASCGSGDASAIPGSSDTMNFDADCDNGAIIDSSFSSTVSVVVLSSGYAGTVTQSNDLTVSSTFTTTGGTWNASNKALTITSTFTMNTGSIFTASSVTTIFSGAFQINGGTFNHNSGTVNFNGTIGATTNCNNAVFNLVTLTNITNRMTINSTCTFPLGSNPIVSLGSTLAGTFSGTGTLTISASTLTLSSGAVFSGFSALSVNGLTMSGATLDLSNYTSVTNPNGIVATSGTLTLSNTSNVITSLTVNGGTVIQSSGTFSASSNVSVSSGSLTLASGADLNGALIVSGGTFTAPSGTMTLAGSLTVSGGTGTFNANGGTITFDGSTATIGCTKSDSSVISFNLVSFLGQTGPKTVSSGCVLPLGNSPTIPNSVTLSGTLSGSGTLTLSANTLTLSSGAVLSGFSGLSVPTLTNAGATTDLSSYTSLTATGTTTASSGTLTLSSTANTLAAMTVSGATISQSTGTFTASGTVTVSSTGNLTLANGADLNGALTVSGGTFTAPSGTMTLAGALTISGTPTFNANGGTIIFDGSSSVSLACNSVNFSLVKFLQDSTATKTVTTNCTLPLGNNPTVTGRLRLNDPTAVVSGTGTFTSTANTSNSLRLTSGSFTGFTAINITGGLSVDGMTLDLSNYTSVYFRGGAGGTASAVNISSGGTLIAPPGIMTLGEAFQNQNSTFTHNNGTVVFDMTGDSDNQNITGSSTFYNLTILPSVNNIFSFGTSRTQTVLGTLTLRGTNTSKLYLRSLTTGLQWYINATGGRVLSNLDVQDGNGIGNTYVCSSCIDSGNNTNWSFINGSSIQFSLNYPNGDSHITNTNPTYRWSKATVSNNSVITKYELYIQPKDAQDNNIGTALYIDNIAPFVGDNKKYQYNPTYTLYDDGDYLNLTPTNYSLPLGKYNFRVVAHDSAGNIAENSVNFWVDSIAASAKVNQVNQAIKYNNFQSKPFDTPNLATPSSTTPYNPPSLKATEGQSNITIQPYSHIPIWAIILILAGFGVAIISIIFLVRKRLSLAS